LQMAIGDGLAVAASRARAFTREDFLRQHPAGLLGRHMIKVRHLMRSGDDLPIVLPHASVAEVTGIISAKRLGAACVTDWQGKLLGLVVDGDIRRLVQCRGDFYATSAGEIMATNPRVIGPDLTMADVLLLLQQEEGRFVLLPVVDDDGILLGLLSTWEVLQ
jgi:arabinose-5-phosphate isomerase